MKLIKSGIIVLIILTALPVLGVYLQFPDGTTYTSESTSVTVFSSFEVDDVLSGGCRISSLDGDGYEISGTDIFVKGLGGNSDRKYNGPLYLKYIKDASYSTVLGNTRVIPSYQMATEISEDEYLILNPDVKRQRDIIAALAEKDRQYALEQIRLKLEKDRADLQNTNNAMALKVFNYRKKQADEGSPSYQYDVGVMYFKGYGVDINTNKAILYINMAYTNNDDRATLFIKSNILSAPYTKFPKL